MKTPEKIYLQACGDCKDNDCENCKFEDLEEITWCRDRIFEKDFEYTRTDAFIEKACEWIKDNGSKYIDIVNGQLVLKKSITRDFKKAMKGE